MVLIKLVSFNYINIVKSVNIFKNVNTDSSVNSANDVERVKEN